MKAAADSPDQALNRLVSKTLAAGMVLAAALMAAGMAIGLARPGWLSHSATALPRLCQAALSGDPTALLSLGIVVLLATPALRVVVLLWGYARRRDWLFAAIALFVLGVLIFSVSVGKTP